MNSKNIIVTTGDLNKEYEIINPVYYQISNKGLLSSALSKKVKEYKKELEQLKSKGQTSDKESDWGLLWGEFYAGQNDFEKAFYISVEELKKRAILIGADAVICMKQDIDMDTNQFQSFYLQMYGTAIKFK